MQRKHDVSADWDDLRHTGDDYYQGSNVTENIYSSTGIKWVSPLPTLPTMQLKNRVTSPESNHQKKLQLLLETQNTF